MKPREATSNLLGVSLLATVLSLAFGLASVASLVASVFQPEPSHSSAARRLLAAIDRHAQQTNESLERFNGRSAFFRPLIPLPPNQIPDQTDEVSAVADPVIPRCPDRYTGPTMIGFVGDEVWFKSRGVDEDVLRIRAGTSNGNLSVRATHLPWSVAVSVDGCDYNLSLWQRDYQSHFNRPAKTHVRGLLQAWEESP